MALVLNPPPFLQLVNTKCTTDIQTNTFSFYPFLAMPLMQQPGTSVPPGVPMGQMGQAMAPQTLPPGKISRLYKSRTEHVLIKYAYRLSTRPAVPHHGGPASDQAEGGGP